MDGIQQKRKRWPDDYEDGATVAARGVRCPKCNCARSGVLWTRNATGCTVRRRRECGNVNCGHLYTTTEGC